MQRLHTTRSTSQTRSGFTLVEMLVATGLVVLIMLMFAQIFGTAVGTMTEQRGLANNDQKARILSSVIRSDLQNMTYRQPAFPYGNVQGIVALAPGDEPIIDPLNQRGYFYYSENAANNDTDDLIQFTVMHQSLSRGDARTKANDAPFVGKARDLAGVDNEPDADDGTIDGKGISRAAEIAYFLRNGNLYRRVLLLRDPLARATKADTQPSNATNGNRRFGSSSPDYVAAVVASATPAPEFYQDFDYSATRRNSALWFNSIESLDNTQGAANFPLAFPTVRFGFASTSSPFVSVEQDSSGNFIGRFTLSETCHVNYDWPGVVPATTYLDEANINLNLTGIDTGEVEELKNGPRRGEDILMNNVESFNVQIVDDSTTFGGSFGDASFDSWHPVAGAVTPSRRLLNNSVGITWNPSTAVALGVTFRVPALQSTGNQSFRYEVITAGNTGGKQPEFPPTPGTIVQDGTAQWQCIDNRIGIKAIKLTIRYRDVQSNQPRQLTIVHSFVE